MGKEKGGISIFQKYLTMRTGNPAKSCFTPQGTAEKIGSFGRKKILKKIKGSKSFTSKNTFLQLTCNAPSWSSQ